MRDKILSTLEQIEQAEGVSNTPDSSSPNHWGLKTKYASVPRSTGKFLASLVEKFKPRSILEIGSSVGYSTLWLASEAEKFGAKITTTEINTGRTSLAKQHFKMAEVENTVSLLEKDAKIVLRDLKEENKIVDFVFLDAFKKEYSEYVDLIYPILREQGIIVIDNVISHENLLNSLFAKLHNDQRFKIEKIDQDNGILILHKIV